VTQPLRSGKSIPPPSQNETWNILGSLIDQETMEARARSNEHSIVKFFRGFSGHKVDPRAFERAYWSNDLVFAVTVDCQYVRHESVSEARAFGSCLQKASNTTESDGWRSCFSTAKRW